MNQTISITATLEEPAVIKTVVETLASRHIDRGFSLSLVPPDWKAIETSGLEANVSGSLEMFLNNNHPGKQIDIPFSSCFLFTCIKGNNGMFNLEWSSSLS